MTYQPATTQVVANGKGTLQQNPADAQENPTPLQQHRQQDAEQQQKKRRGPDRAEESHGPSKSKPDSRQQQQRSKQDTRRQQASDSVKQDSRAAKEAPEDRPSSRQAAAAQQQWRQNCRQPIPTPETRPGAADDRRERMASPRGAASSKGANHGRTGNSSKDPKPSQTRASGRQASPSRDHKHDKGSARDTARDGQRQEAPRSTKAHTRSTRQDAHNDQHRDRDRERERERAVNAAKDKTRDSASQQPNRERERERGREKECERQRGQDKPHDRERERAGARSRSRSRQRSRSKDRSRDRSRSRSMNRKRGSSRSPGQLREPASGSRGRGKAAAPSGPSPFDVVDKFLVKQSLVQEVLSPTPMNVNTIHVPGVELLSYIEVQQWVQDKFNTPLPLLNGAFVLVSSGDIPELCPRDVMEACGHQRNSSSSFTQAVAGSIPWRLRQIEQVELKPGAQPDEATLLLEGGGCVRASSVSPDSLSETLDYEYLCCELAVLQDSCQMQLLKVYDIAHVAWRMRVGGELEEAIAGFNKEQAELKGADHEPDVIEGAAQVAFENIKNNMKKLPPIDWVDNHIMQYVELNPFARPEHPSETRQVLSKDQVNSLVRCASDAWRYYVKHQLSGQQQPPKPVTEYVPWKPLPLDEVVAEAGGAADGLVAPGQYGSQGYQQHHLDNQGAAVPPAGVQQLQQVQLLAPEAPAQQQQAPGAGGSAAAMGQGAAAHTAVLPGAAGSTGLIAQQPRLPLLDINDEFADEYGFFDDPLAPLEVTTLGPLGAPGSAAGALSGPPSTTTPSGALAPKGFLGAGMSLTDQAPGSGSGLLHKAAGGSGPYGSGSMAAAVGAAAPAEGAGRSADYSYWVERGNAAAAAADPRRFNAAGRSAAAAAAASLAESGLPTNPLGPMWGGQKPPPGMADVGIGGSNRQQRDGGSQGQPGGRGSVLDRLSPPGMAPARGRDGPAKDWEPRGRHDPSAFSMDARPRAGAGGRQPSSRYSSRSPPRPGGGSRGRSRSPAGRQSRGRRYVTPPQSPSRGRSPDGGKGTDRRDGAAAGASSGRGYGSRSRGQSPPKGRSPSKGHRRDSSREGRGRGRDRARSGSPSSSKRRRETAASADTDKQGLASAGGSKRSRLDVKDVAGSDAAAGRVISLVSPRDQLVSPRDQQWPEPLHRDSSPRRTRGPEAAAAAADSEGLPLQSPSDDIQAVARRFDGRLEGAQGIFADIQLEKDVKAWLRELAVFAGRPPRPLEQPNPIKLVTLAKQMPLPQRIVQQYGGMHSFVRARPELTFSDKQNILLNVQHHAELLASRSITSPLPHAAGVAVEGSDPEDYLAGHRASKRKGSSTRQERELEAAEDRSRPLPGGAGAPGSGGRSTGSGKGSRREQQPPWAEDRQPFPAPPADRVQADTDAGVDDDRRTGSFSRRPAAAEAAMQPRATRAQGNRYDLNGSAGQVGRGSRGNDDKQPPAARILAPHVADAVLKEFGRKLSVTVQESPGHLVPELIAYQLLPVPLADRVRANTKLTMKKLIQDYYPEFVVRKDGPSGPLCVTRNPNPRHTSVVRSCKFWNPITLDGCVKHSVCDFKHDLVPSAAHF